MLLAGGSGVEVIAHRGASAVAPENTTAAFDRAVALGAHTLELDLRTTADGEAVVLHDPTLLRTHGDPRAVADVALADLPELPTLREVLDRYAGRVRLLLEVKPGVRADAVVAAAAGRPGVVVQSFDRVALQCVRRGDPALRVAPLFTAAPTARQLDRAARRGDEGVGVPHPAVTAALVSRAHARGLRVRAWTANAPEELARLVARGVVGLITDVPADALAVAAAQRVCAAA